MNLDDLPMSARLSNALKVAGHRTVADVAALSEASILRIAHLGIGSLREWEGLLVDALRQNPNLIYDTVRVHLLNDRHRRHVQADK